MNVFELLGMVMTAWALTVHAGDRREYPGQSILMRGDNMSAVHWVNKCRGAKEPRSGALMRMMGCLEMRNEWRFRAKHIKGLANTLADGISRWKHEEITAKLRSFRPDICWQEQKLGQEAVDLTSIRGVGLKLIGRSIAQSSQRSYASSFRSWCAFRRLMGCGVFLEGDMSSEAMTWALVDFAAWCFESESNQAGTISGKIAAVQYFHRLNRQVEIDTSSPLLKCALRGVARSQVDLGMRRRVRLPVTWSMLKNSEDIIHSWGAAGRVTWLCLSLSYFLIARSDEMFASSSGGRTPSTLPHATGCCIFQREEPVGSTCTGSRRIGWKLISGVTKGIKTK